MTRLWDKTNEFFGIRAPLFIETGLEGDNVKRFVNREQLLEAFITAIGMKRRCAVVGKQGSGKSSFLHKLHHKIKDSAYCDYLQLSFPIGEAEKSRLHFLRKVLRSILCLIVKNDALLALYDKEDIRFELERLEHSVIIEDHTKSNRSIDGEVGGGITPTLFNMLIPADFRAKLSTKKESESGRVHRKEYALHDENTLYELILSLLDKMDEPILLFIDEMDKVGRYPLESPEWDREVMQILELSRDVMRSQKLVLVFALQMEIYTKLLKAERNEGDLSILGLINFFRKLDLFDIDFAMDAVNASLRYAGYQGAIDDLFDERVIPIVLEKCGGNPRLFMHYLAELAHDAVIEKEKKISLHLLKKLMFRVYPKMDLEGWEQLKKKYQPEKKAKR